jgi:penicillin amidase
VSNSGYRAASLVAAILLVVGCGSGQAEAAHGETWTVKGLTAPAELVIDRWGIPHIFAGSRRDAFFLQGYNAARDRLWQIDLWRKRGLGRLSESLGASYVDQDRAARLFLYRGDMNREWASYAPRAHEDAEAFVEGLNAYVTEVMAGTKPLPVEFHLTDSKPEMWSVDDVLRIRSHALVANVSSEVARARVACAAGLEADKIRRHLEPPHTTTIPDGLNPCDVPADVLKDYHLGTGAVTFTAPQPAPVAPAPPQSGDGSQRAELEEQAAEGSNNWVIAPSHSTTGHAVLANDPHRALGVPALRYIVGMSAPDFAVIGAGEPALPGISLGHNGHTSFGITIFDIDQEDLYVYELKPGAPDFYRYKNGWEPMRIVHEAIAVRGGAPRNVELRFTRHGPVLYLDAKNNRAFALRTVWNEPGASGYFGSSRMWDAKNWDDFLKARDGWGSPPLNLVYADTDGNIGWAPGGLTPIRPNWDGLLPVPGDGRYEWQGFLAGRDLPSAENPPEGWFATANEMNLPEGYPNEQRKISFEWTDPSRITRIKKVLGSKDELSLKDSMDLQTDTHSEQAARLIHLLEPLDSNEPIIAKALRILKSWDRDETITSPAAVIYEDWVSRHLGQMAIARAVPKAADAITAPPGATLDAIVTYLENPDSALGPDALKMRDAILLASFGESILELSQALGPDPESWAWGALHRAEFVPAIAPLADPALRAKMVLGPTPLPGSASTPRAASYRNSDFVATSGASVRMVLDTGNWDNSVAINTPGESGDPSNPHYRDLFPLWAQGKYVPLLFTHDAVERQAETVLKLVPSN